MTTNEDLHELIAAYALDVLHADERRAFEEHLRACKQCQENLAHLTETVGALALAVEPATPSEGLRGRILDAARSEGSSNVVAIRSSRRRFAVAGVAAAVAAAGLAIGLYAALSGGSTNPRLALSAPTSQGVTKVTVSGFEAAQAGRIYELWVIEGKTPRPAGIFTGGEKQVVSLTRPAPVGSTVAVTLERAGGSTDRRLALSAPTSQGLTRVTVSGFDAAPAGRIYELWVIEGKTPRPAGLFTGGEKQVVSLTRPAPVGSTVAVTLERTGGAKAPTPPVLVPTPVGAKAPTPPVLVPTPVTA
jgi:anti-sigma-K factor RskA